MTRAQYARDMLTVWISNVRWHIENNGHLMTSDERSHEYARISAWEDALRLLTPTSCDCGLPKGNHDPFCGKD